MLFCCLWSQKVFIVVSTFLFRDQILFVALKFALCFSLPMKFDYLQWLYIWPIDKVWAWCLLGINILKLILCRQSPSKNRRLNPDNFSSCSLLEKTCDLIKKFPEYFDVVVSVARKTDGRHWADLFSAAGRSTEYVIVLCY